MKNKHLAALLSLSSPSFADDISPITLQTVLGIVCSGDMNLITKSESKPLRAFGYHAKSQKVSGDDIVYELYKYKNR